MLYVYVYSLMPIPVLVIFKSVQCGVSPQMSTLLEFLCAALCFVVLCCVVLCCVVLCCLVLCCSVLCCLVLCCLVAWVG